MLVSFEKASGKSGQWISIAPVTYGDTYWTSSWKYVTGNDGENVSITLSTDLANRDCELRLYEDGAFKVIARSKTFRVLGSARDSPTVTVCGSGSRPPANMPKATIIVASSSILKVGTGRIDYNFTGAGNQSGQWGGLFASAMPSTSYLDWKYVGGIDSRAQSLPTDLATQPGWYSLRVF